MAPVVSVSAGDGGGPEAGPGNDGSGADGGPTLVVNAGGATLALSLVDGGGTRLAHRTVDPWDGHDPGPLRVFLAEAGATAPPPTAVGHRVVHGGDLDQPVVIDDAVRRAIGAAGALSPVHQERALAGIAAATAELPGLAHVACFDTTFHRTLPDRAAVYAVPAEWRRRWPLQRRGFHGLSHGYVAQVAPGLRTGSAARGRVDRVVSCHLGSGVSLCAIDRGRSVDTTMGATPLEGLVMARRSGSVDPGIVLWLLDEAGLGIDEVRHGLSAGGGLAGLAGGSGDLRDVLARRAAGDAQAGLAFDVYIHRLRAGIAAMAAALGGVDLLAFTGGVGEHLPAVRAAAVAGLGFLGLAIVDEGPEPTDGHRDLTAPGAAAGCVVVATGEDVAIAAATRTLLATGGPGSRGRHSIRALTPGAGNRLLTSEIRRDGPTPSEP